MSKIVSDKTAIWLTKGALPTSVSITSIGTASPAVVQLSAIPTGLVDGDFVLIKGTGRADLDGKYWQATAVGTPANALSLEGSDAGAAVGALGTLTPFNLGGASPEFWKACESSITVNGQEPDSVDLSDMCDAMTKLGDPKPPTVSFTGFTNTGDPGFINMIQASLESPKTDRVLSIIFPDGEYITGPAQIGAVSVSAARGQGLSYSGTATFTEIPTYSWVL